MKPRGLLATLEPHARPLPFGYDTPDSDQQTFDVRLSDIGGRRLGKYGSERFRLFAVHLDIQAGDFILCNHIPAGAPPI